MNNKILSGLIFILLLLGANRLLAGSPPPNCQAQFTYQVDTANSMMVHFNNQSTGNITNVFWDFGDNSNATTYNPSHTYATTGSYFVTLLVIDSNAICMDSVTYLVTVGGSSCHTDFIYMVDTINKLKVQFFDISQPNASSWSWDFGDNTSSTIQNPQHTFAHDGTYTVTLISGTPSCSDSISKQVVVQSNPSPTGSLLTYLFADSLAYDSAQLFLYKYDKQNGLQIVDSSLVEYSSGISYYNFTQVPLGYYRIFAKVLNPNSNYYDTWSQSSYYWAEADSVLVNSNAAIEIMSLQKSSVSYPAGNASISGILQKENNSGNFVPINNACIYLLLDKHHIITKTYTDAQGAFEFPSLAFGTYYIHPEVKGIFTNNEKVVLDFNNPLVDTLTFTIYGKQISTGIQLLDGSYAKLQVYPNPVNDVLHIALDKNMEAQVQICDLSGRILWQEKRFFMSGMQEDFNLSNLDNGLYFITIINKSFRLSKKIIKK